MPLAPEASQVTLRVVGEAAAHDPRDRLAFHPGNLGELVGSAHADRHHGQEHAGGLRHDYLIEQWFPNSVGR